VLLSTLKHVLARLTLPLQYASASANGSMKRSARTIVVLGNICNTAAEALKGSTKRRIFLQEAHCPTVTWDTRTRLRRQSIAATDRGSLRMLDIVYASLWQVCALRAARDKFTVSVVATLRRDRATQAMMLHFQRLDRTRHSMIRWDGQQLFACGKRTSLAVPWRKFRIVNFRDTHSLVTLVISCMSLPIF
jgi:hypothetical protein